MDTISFDCRQRKCHWKSSSVTDKELRALIKLFRIDGKSVDDIHKWLKRVLGEMAYSRTAVGYWVTKFNKGNYDTETEKRGESKRTVRTNNDSVIKNHFPYE
jgi:hypothetical protein